MAQMFAHDAMPAKRYPKAVLLSKEQAKILRKAEELVEPLLIGDKERFSLYPLHHQNIYDVYQKAMAHDWRVDKAQLSTDVYQYNNVLTAPEKHLINSIFAFFQPADGIVGENHLVNLYKRIKLPEVRSYYATQIHMEHIHSDAYGRVVSELIPDLDRRRKVLSTDDKPAIKAMLGWMEEWLDGKITLAETLFAFAIAEGLLFQAPFCFIFWFKKRGGNLLPGIMYLNVEISADENDHATFSAIMYYLIINKLPYERVLEMMLSAVQVAYDFVDYALPEPLVGLSARGAKLYIEFIADYLLKIFGYPKYFNTLNPYDWMEELGLYSRENVFEKTVANYSSMPGFTPVDVEEFEVTDQF